MTTFNDIFTSAFLDRMTAVPLIDMIVAMVLAGALGLFIFLIYRRTTTGILYSSTFGVCLVVITLVTTLVILAVSSNVLLSLGMVGALSIVRFRTPVKEPLDIVFLFWCIATGIVLAAGLLFLAICGCIFIGLALLLLTGRAANDRPYLLVVRCGADADEAEVTALIQAGTRAQSLKAKQVAAGALDLTYEVRLADGKTDIVAALDALPAVTEALLVSYNGDYQG